MVRQSDGKSYYRPENLRNLGVRKAPGRRHMDRAELDMALARLGLDVPEKERDEIASAAHFITEMAARLRPQRRRRVGASATARRPQRRPARAGAPPRPPRGARGRPGGPAPCRPFPGGGGVGPEIPTLGGGD